MSSVTPCQHSTPLVHVSTASDRLQCLRTENSAEHYLAAQGNLLQPIDHDIVTSFTALQHHFNHTSLHHHLLRENDSQLLASTRSSQGFLSQWLAQTSITLITAQRPKNRSRLENACSAHAIALRSRTSRASPLLLRASLGCSGRLHAAQDRLRWPTQ